MNRLCCRISDPYDAVPRVMDHARKSGFLPIDLHLRPCEAGVFLMQVEFGPASAISFATLTDLVRRIATVLDLETEPPTDAASHPLAT